MNLDKKFGLKNYWIITYLVVFLVPVVILSVILFTVENMVLNVTDNYSNSMLLQTQKTVDDEIKNIHKFILNLNTFDELNNIIALDNVSVYDHMSYYGIEKNIYNSAANYNISNDFYIYLKKSDVAITKTGILTSHSTYLQYAIDLGINYEEWKTRLIEEKNFSFWKLSDNKNSDALYMTYALKSNNFSGETATAVIKVNSNQIEEIINQNIYGGTVFLLSDDNQVEFTFGSSMEYEKINFAELTGFEETTKKRINGVTCLVSAAKSSVGDYSYLVITPFNSLTKQVGLLKFWLVVLILLTVLVGTTLVVKTVKKNYAPIEELVYQLESTFKDETDANDKKPLTYESIDDIRKNLITYSKKYNYGQKAVQASQISKLLNFEIDKPDSSLDSFFNEFAEGNIVILFEPVKYVDFFKNESESEQIDTVHFMINNVLDEIISDVYFLTANINKTFVTVLAADYANREAFIKDITGRMEEVVNFFAENFDIDLAVSVGSLEKNPVDIRASYINAQEALMYHSVFRADDVLCYDDIAERENKYYFTKEDSKRLINYVKCGNSEQAIKFIDEIFENNIYVKKISYKYIRILLFEIVLTIQKSIENIDELMAFDDKDVFKILQNFENIEKFKEDIMLMVESICNRGTDNGENDICHKIIDYIEVNYSDINMSNDDIAAHCGLTKSYISTVFKKEKGENLVAFITRLRLDKSKDLLLTNLNISDVANKSGFVNSNTYIRAFKKFEGITPGLWRKNIKK